MQLVEAALAEQLDPAHESCAAVNSGLIGSREEQAWQQEEELPSSHSRCLITTFVRSADRVKRSYECLAHTCDEEPRHSLPAECAGGAAAAIYVSSVAGSPNQHEQHGSR